MSAELASVLVVQVIGFLTLIVTAIATAKKASSERRDAAAEAVRQAEQVRADLEQKAKLDAERDKRADERAERDWNRARQDRIDADKKAERIAREMTVSIDGASRMARAAYAATGLGPGLDDATPPVPNRRMRVGTAADRKPPPADEPLVDFGARVLFAPGAEDDDLGAAATVTGASP